MRKASLSNGARHTLALSKASAKPVDFYGQKLTTELIDRVAAFFLRGLPVDAVCDMLCLSNQQFFDWKRKGQMYLEAGCTPQKNALYGEFLIRMRQATAEYRLSLVDRMHNTASKMWVRDMAILERRDRANFSRFDQPGGTDDEFDPDERFL